ncbi:MAG: LLM class flavin-dependent oxidoreductase [Nitrososphaeria archaeon]
MNKRLGFQVDSYDSLSYTEYVEAAKKAESVGFDYFWKGEVNARDSVSVLSVVAFATSKIKIGSSAMSIVTRSPVMTAMTALSLNELSNGRFVLGLGVSNRNIAAWHGFSFERPYVMMKEYLTIIKSIFNGERTGFRGRFYSSSNFKSVLKPARVPIYLATLSPAIARLAGRMAEGIIVNLADRNRLEKLRNEAMNTLPNNKEFEVLREVRVSAGDDVQAAKRAIRRTLAFYALADYYREMFQEMGLKDLVEKLQDAFKAGGFSATERAIADEDILKIEGLVFGSREEVWKRILELYESTSYGINIVYIPSTAQPVAEVIKFLDAGSAFLKRISDEKFINK